MQHHSSVITLRVTADSTGALQGKMIKLAREARGMTQKQLAKELKVSRATISRWESIGIGDEIYRLEQALDVEHGTFKIDSI